MKNSNENKYRNKLRASRTVNIVLSVLLILSVCIAPIFAAASNRFDVTGDGLVDTRDIVRMMKYIAGAIDEDGNPITPGDNDDSGDKPSVTPAYNTILVNGVPIYSYSGHMYAEDIEATHALNETLRHYENEGKVFRVPISIKLIEQSKDYLYSSDVPVIPTICDDNDRIYQLEWTDKEQNRISNPYVLSSVNDGEGNHIYHYAGGVLRYLQKYSVGEVVPVSLKAHMRYNSNETSMDKYNGTYDRHRGEVYYDVIIEFIITE